MFNVEDVTDDELAVIADDNQDLPPYDHDAIAGTFTSMCTSEPAMCGDHSAPKDTVFFDAPFGLLRLDMVKTADANGNLATEVPYFIEVLGISEMQGWLFQIEEVTMTIELDPGTIRMLVLAALIICGASVEQLGLV